MGLKPGFVIKARNNFGVEARALDRRLVLHRHGDGYRILAVAAGTDDLQVYGPKSVAAILSPNATLTSGSYTLPSFY